MKKILKVIFPLLFVAAVCLVAMFRTVPAGRLWENYKVLYVSINVEDSSVMAAMKQSGIDEVVSLYGQFLPLCIAENTLEYAMFKTTIDSQDNEYIKNRKAYFFDKKHEYRLYYIPNDYERNINSCISILKKDGIECGLDSTVRYPFMFPLVVVLLAFAVCFFCKNKLLFIFSSILPVLYVFCNPFFPIALSICLLILCSFFVSNIWRRRGAVSYLNSFLFIPICFIIALLCAFSSSLLSGFLFLAVAIGMVCIFFSYYWIQDYARSRKSFVPVYIRPAKIVNIRLNEFKVVFSMVLFASLLLLFLYLFTSSDSFVKKVPGLQLPGISDIEDPELPQFDDYYKWAWNVKTYPYRSLNEDKKSNRMAVSFPSYISDGGVVRVVEKKFIYDDEFKNDIFNDISNLKFNSIEEVMKSEGIAFKGGYISTNSYHIDLFGIIMIIMCYFILLFIYLSIIIRAKKGAKNDIE